MFNSNKKYFDKRIKFVQNALICTIDPLLADKRIKYKEAANIEKLITLLFSFFKVFLSISFVMKNIQ